MKKQESGTTKFIFVTGGVLSSLGKGISSSSISVLLQASNFKVSVLKIDPYINVDPGTMSPLEHGEVFVTADGAETDLDIGHYERFLNKSLGKKNNFTTGQVYLSVIEKERKGEYLGKTIQIVPHIVDEIKRRILDAGRDNDFLIVELGGTIGDMEGMPYLEAMREIKHELGGNRVISIHVTLIPFIKAAGELKTKPTQHSVQELRRLGITPQIIIARTETKLSKDIKDKIAMSCDVESVIEAIDSASIYKCPINFLNEGILEPLSKFFNIEIKPDMSQWDSLVKKILAPKNCVNIGFVGKYLALKESYKSLIEALIHAGANTDTLVNIKYIDAESLENNPNFGELLKDVDGILVPGGFGHRGIEGKINAITYARENKIPFLGICLGMQLSIIEFARNVLKLEDASSTEFNKNCKNKMIYLINDFIDNEGVKQIRTHVSQIGGTMRLGEYPCEVKKGTKLHKAYGSDMIFERHRHRFEANPKYKEELEKNGMIISGQSSGLIEVVEIENHPWFVATQFHPEFTSRLQNPNAIILEFVKQSLHHKK